MLRRVLDGLISLLGILFRLFSYPLTGSEPLSPNIILTDPGNEIDDEILLEVLMNRSVDKHWIVVCVPGNTSMDPSTSAHHSNERIQRLRRVFPDKFGSRNSWTSHLGSKFTIGDMSLLSTVDRKVQFLLQVAPLWHVPADYLCRLLIETRIVLGDAKHPKESINLLKSIPSTPLENPREEEWRSNLISQFHKLDHILNSNSEQTIYIPTKFARQVPTPFSLVCKLPDTLTAPLLHTAFVQFVTRVDPELAWAEDISVVNHETILNYLSESQRKDVTKSDGIQSVPRVIRKNIKYQVKRFLSSLAHSTESYHKRLEEIAMAVYLITRMPYCPQNGQIFAASTLMDPDTAEDNWRRYIYTNRCDLTPAYDVLAWVVMEVGYLPSARQCSKALESY